MPDIKIKHVLSCNSEDKGYPADNILSQDPAKKWKCLPGVRLKADGQNPRMDLSTGLPDSHFNPISLRESNLGSGRLSLKPDRQNPEGGTLHSPRSQYVDDVGYSFPSVSMGTA